MIGVFIIVLPRPIFNESALLALLRLCGNVRGLCGLHEDYSLFSPLCCVLAENGQGVWVS